MHAEISTVEEFEEFEEFEEYGGSNLSRGR